MPAHDSTPPSAFLPGQGLDVCTLMWVLLVPSDSAVRLHHGLWHGVQCSYAPRACQCNCPR